MTYAVCHVQVQFPPNKGEELFFMGYGGQVLYSTVTPFIPYTGTYNSTRVAKLAHCLHTPDRL